MHHRKDSLCMINMYEVIYDESKSKVGEEKKCSYNLGGHDFGLWEEAEEDPRGHGGH